MGVSDRRIAAEIRDGAETVEEIARCTGAGTRCGSCRGDIEAMLRCAERERVENPAPPDERFHLSLLPMDAIAAE